MAKQDKWIAFSLLILAVIIWVIDLNWVTTYEDTLPILVALPLAWWLGRPWKFNNSFTPPNLIWMGGSLLFFLFGFALNINLFLAIGWTALLWSWLKERLIDTKKKKLLILCLMSFPWITLDLKPLSWGFRITGTYVAASLFSMLGFDVQQQGTNLLVNHIPISVDAACAGMNTLQSMLIAGACLLYLFLKESSLFWWNVPLLFVIAWIANTLRIITIAQAAIIISPAFAIGTFHTLGGWLVILLMFLLSFAIFSLQEPKKAQQ